MKNIQIFILMSILLFLTSRIFFANWDNFIGGIQEMPGIGRALFYRGGYQSVRFASAGDYGSFKGFEIQKAVDGLNAPSFFTFGNHQEIYIISSVEGIITQAVDENKDGLYEKKYVFTRELRNPSGAVFHNQKLYLIDGGKLISIEDSNGDHEGDIYEDIITGLPPGEYHKLIRNSNGAFYAAVTRTRCENKNCHLEGSVLFMDPESRDWGTHAAGFANPYGLAFYPFNEDMIGGDSVTSSKLVEEINLIIEGFHYGAPSCAGYDIENQCPESVPALIAFPNGIGIRGISFYTGYRFPPDYQNNLFLALHGKPSGDPSYGRSIIRVKLIPASGSYQTEVLEFARGFNRPVDIQEGPDENLYVLDEGEGEIYRIAPVFK